MKKSIFAIFVLLVTLKLSAQSSFIGFDQPICSASMSNAYSYVNVTGPGGPSSATHGYQIFRNGNLIYNVPGGSQSWSTYALDLIFINDSVGFLVSWGNGAGYVSKTSDCGNSWVGIGGGYPGYEALYVVNANFAYFVAINSNICVVMKCSDNAPQAAGSYFIFDSNINADIYKTDTILGNSLCNIDSLNIFVKNSIGDTIDYHINFFSVPNFVSETKLPSGSYNIFPNPAQNIISLKGVDIIYAEIYNTQGEKMYQGNSKTINIEKFSNGIYFIRIIDFDEKEHIFKFLKE